MSVKKKWDSHVLHLIPQPLSSLSIGERVQRGTRRGGRQDWAHDVVVDKVGSWEGRWRPRRHFLASSSSTISSSTTAACGTAPPWPSWRLMGCSWPCAPSLAVAAVRRGVQECFSWFVSLTTAVQKTARLKKGVGRGGGRDGSWSGSPSPSNIKVRTSP